MKKLYVNSVSILFAVLCLVFTACNGMLTDGDTGTVRVVIGGGGAARSVDAAGLPIFHKDNTTITVTDENGHKLVDAEQKTEVILPLPVGTEITIEVKVTTAAGVWRGSKDHTVAAGDNFIVVKLSKTPKIMRNILINSSGRAASLKLESGEELLTGAALDTHSNRYPITARDKIGRIYVLYQTPAAPSTSLLKRFDVEGNEDTDTGFETKLNSALTVGSHGVTIDDIDNIAIDIEENYIFLFKGSNIYCLKEKEDHSFEYISVYGSFPIPAASLNVTAVAVYDDVLFVADGTTLYACKFEIESNQLQFQPAGGHHAASLNLPKLRTDTVFGNNLTNCTGLFADEDNVYCLLSENSVAGNQWYMVGSVVQCAYKDNGTLEQKGVKGLNPDASTAESIKFNPAYFSNPVGFIGSDEDNLYIADDGVDFAYKNENWHITANKNRIAALNRKTHDLTFKDAGATWYGDEKPYTRPDTPVLLWGKDSNNAFRYWTSADGTDTYSSDNTLFASSLSEKPTDVFCYDQDGNLYILWRGGSGYKVRRFELKNGVSYDGTARVDSPAIGSGPRIPKYIAVDISDGQNCLYYGNDDGGWWVSKLIWGDNFSGLGTETNVIRSITGEMTALAANKDGVFVATKEEQTVPSATYTLKVTKYKKDSPDTSDGEITIVSSAIAEDSYSYPDSYNEYNEAIYDLRIVDGVLYAVTSKIEKGMKDNSGYQLDSFKNGSVLYKIAKTASFSGNAEKRAEKNPVPPEGTNPGVGYGFYRFIAVKPKKLVIASDSAWGKDGITASHVKANNNKVFEYDLDKNLLEEKNAGGIFSKELQREPLSSGFEWE